MVLAEGKSLADIGYGGMGSLEERNCRSAIQKSRPPRSKMMVNVFPRGAAGCLHSPAVGFTGHPHYVFATRFQRSLFMMQVVQSPRIHPLIAAAATSIILVCMLGVAAIAYLLPFGRDDAASMALLSRQVSSTPEPGPTPTPALVAAAPLSGMAAPIAGPFSGSSVAIGTATPISPTLPIPSRESSARQSAALATTQPEASTLIAADQTVQSPVASAVGAGLSLDGVAPTTTRRSIEHAPMPARSFGHGKVKLAAAHRATQALASAQNAVPASAEDPPARLRPEQLEAASRATALLAQSALETPAQKAAREMAAAKARGSHLQAEPAAAN